MIISSCWHHWFDSHDCGRQGTRRKSVRVNSTFWNHHARMRKMDPCAPYLPFSVVRLDHTRPHFHSMWYSIRAAGFLALCTRVRLLPSFYEYRAAVDGSRVCREGETPANAQRTPETALRTHQTTSAVTSTRAARSHAAGRVELYTYILIILVRVFGHHNENLA